MKNAANFVQVVPQTKEEKVVMYMKYSKEEIIEMLLNCQDVIENQQKKNCNNCIYYREIHSGYTTKPIEIICLRLRTDISKNVENGIVCEFYDTTVR